MRIALVSPEIAPFSKTGGLADVSRSLPRALAALGAEVATVSPLYRSAKDHAPESLPLRLRVPLGAGVLEAGVARSDRDYFIGQDAFFDRDGLYGTPQGDYADNSSRFIFFCRAALELLRELGPPDVIHVHDWQGGLVPAYLRTIHAGSFPRTRSVFTVHNLAYQGIFNPGDMDLTGLDWKHFNWRELEYHGKINFLKAGLVYADAVTTVSPSYAREIRTPELGCGLDGVLRERSASLRGILNGADYSEWNPETDPHLAANYSARSLAGKAKCKAALQRRCGLPVRPGVPLAGMVGRLAEQKGIDLLLEAARALSEEDLQVVLLGMGDQYYQDAVLFLGTRYPGKFSVHVAFDEALAHQIEAGCDLFLMPSRYEPCGLNQIYGLRYGTVPVVRATGGLTDTVEDGVTGFVFGDYTAGALLSAVRRALAAYGRPGEWRKMIRAGMRMDYGWERSARRYLDLYGSLVAELRG